MDYTALLATTIKNYRKKMEDNIFKAQIFLNELLSKGRVEEKDGGTHIVEPLMYGKNSTAGSYDGYDPLDTTAQGGIGAAEFNWKQIAVSISISGREELLNQGKSQVLSLLKSKVEQAEMSIREVITEMLFGDGTGNSSKDLVGLQALIADGSDGTLGGINRTTYNWWRNQSEYFDLNGATWGSSSDTGIAKMRTAYNKASKGSMHPQLIQTDRASYELYEGAAVEIERFGTNKLADMGFEAIKFKGANMVYDAYCPTGSVNAKGSMYFLNFNFLRLVIHKACRFITTPFRVPVNQHAKVAFILLMANFTCSNCARQAVIQYEDATPLTALEA